MKDFPDEGLAAVGVRGPIVLDDLLHWVRKANRIAPVQALRADRVVGWDHLRSAAWHAARAQSEGRAQAERPEVEFLRYAAGERQIQRALDKMGVAADGQDVVLAALGPRRTDALRYAVDAIPLEEDDGVVAADEERLRAFGITERQLFATTPARRLDLVLEAVAEVDLLR